jgi:hypothetical protein
MRIMRRVLSPLLVVCTLTLAGCDTTNAPAPDDKEVDYAKKSADKMNEMYGVPANGGVLKK